MAAVREAGGMHMLGTFMPLYVINAAKKLGGKRAERGETFSGYGIMAGRASNTVGFYNNFGRTVPD